MAMPTFNLTGMIGGKYQLLRALGEGGFGKVYLALDPATLFPRAVKTIRPEYVANIQSRQAFERELLLWINLGQHPFILDAHLVWEYSGQFFVAMSWIQADPSGRVSLQDYLTGKPLRTEEVLTWGIQFCEGIRHALSHGIKCHRDIKPSNILIGADPMAEEYIGAVRISDFGLAAAAHSSSEQGKHRPSMQDCNKTLGFSHIRSDGRMICGTPGYIAPEIALGKEADETSDIYSFGVVLWQMKTGCPLSPFHVDGIRDVDEYQQAILQRQLRHQFPSALGRFEDLIRRCLAADFGHRYSSFKELQNDLELLYKTARGQQFQLPPLRADSAESWHRKGFSLFALGQYEASLNSYAKALQLGGSSEALYNNIGLALRLLGRLEESLNYLVRATEIDPQSVRAWTNMGLTMSELNRHEEALACQATATRIDPGCVDAWGNRGNAEYDLKKYNEALESYSKAAEFDPKDSRNWVNKGVALNKLGQVDGAVSAFRTALRLNPLDPSIWFNLGQVLLSNKQHGPAAECYAKGLELAPASAAHWNKYALCLHQLGRKEDAIRAIKKALELEPDNKVFLMGAAIFLGN